VRKFASEYEENYAQYKFINERFEHLKELKQKNTELREASSKLHEEESNIKTSRSCKDILDS
jgi:hypothetical protein